MSEINKLGTWIHGIAATEDLDTSGERIKLKGIDISTLPIDGLLSWEHQNSEPMQIVGKILFAKKIFKKEDCENKSHEHFWKLNNEKPYLYVAGVLFDNLNHPGAISVAAMLKFDQMLDKKVTKQTVNFSIEGNRLDKDANGKPKIGGNVDNCIARKVTITNLACNKACVAEILKDPEDSGAIKEDSLDDIFKKCEDAGILLTKDEKKYYKELANHNKLHPSKKPNYTPTPKASSLIYTGAGTKQAFKPTEFKPKVTLNPSQITNKIKLKVGTRIEYKKPKGLMKNNFNNIQKALIAGLGVGSAPGANVNALDKESVKKNLMSITEEALNRFEKREQLIEFITSKVPELSKAEVIGIASILAYVKESKREEKLSKLIE
jgi:hypothetical protein